jgi:phosphonopyruvate decarboxylase
MVDPTAFLARLTELDVTFATGVPDSLLKDFGQCLMQEWPQERHIIAANEGNAVALAMGHYLATGRPALVYLQNSGLGNTINPLLSLADPEVYGIPMILIVGWRGQPGVPDEPQHVKQGRIMSALLDATEHPWAVLPHDHAAATVALEAAVEVSVSARTPYVLLVEKGTFAPFDAGTEAGGARPADVDSVDALPTREDALRILVTEIGDEAAYVGTTGMLSRELFEHRTAGIGRGDRDLLSVGGMGHASSMALGVALRTPEREVWCLDGDGALLMHLGALPVIAANAPGTLFHVIVNNAVHDSVGGQPTAIDGVDLPALARSAGYRHAERVAALADLPAAVERLRAHGGPSLLEVRVRPGNRPDLGRPTRTPQESRDLFMRALH